MKTTQTKVSVSVLALAGLLAFSLLAIAGSLEPGSPPGPTMHSLDEIYNSVAGPPEFVPSVKRGPSDIYAKFGNLEGEAQEQNHDGWCEVVSFKQGQLRPLEGTGPTRLRGPVEFDEVTLVKTLDKASPKLAEAVCTGMAYPTVLIHVTASYGGSGPVKYYAYEFKDATVTSYSISGAGQSEEIPTEEVTFDFKEIKVTYTECNENGTPKGNVEYTYDLETEPM